MASEDNSKIEAGNLFRVDGLVAVITGGGTGLGRYMARALAINGAEKIFILGRREEPLKKTAASVPGGKIVPLVGDVTSKDSLESAAARVKAEVGWVDVLIANSGVSGPIVKLVEGKETLPISDLAKNLWAPSHEDVTASHGVNVTSTQFLVAAFLDLLNEANKRRPTPPTLENFKPRPQIITTASIAAYSRLPMGNIVYGPSKTALIQMTKQFSSLLAPHDIRANVIAPGLYLSEMTDGMMSQNSTIEGGVDRHICPATRCGNEQDMAGVVLWLTSRAGAYTNGCVVITDGGRMGVYPGSY